MKKPWIIYWLIEALLLLAFPCSMLIGNLLQPLLGCENSFELGTAGCTSEIAYHLSNFLGLFVLLSMFIAMPLSVLLAVIGLVTMLITHLRKKFPTINKN